MTSPWTNSTWSFRYRAHACVPSWNVTYRLGLRPQCNQSGCSRLLTFLFLISWSWAWIWASFGPKQKRKSLGKWLKFHFYKNGLFKYGLLYLLTLEYTIFNIWRPKETIFYHFETILMVQGPSRLNWNVFRSPFI